MLSTVFEYMKNEQIELTAEEYLSELIKHIGEANSVDELSNLLASVRQCYVLAMIFPVANCSKIC